MSGPLIPADFKRWERIVLFAILGVFALGALWTVITLGPHIFDLGLR